MRNVFFKVVTVRTGIGRGYRVTQSRRAGETLVEEGIGLKLGLIKRKKGYHGGVKKKVHVHGCHLFLLA